MGRYEDESPFVDRDADFAPAAPQAAPVQQSPQTAQPVQASQPAQQMCIRDSIGGVQVTVEYRLDDPRVGHVVIPPGEQTLNGEQAVAFVSATNYQGGRTQRTANQMEFFFDLINKMTSSEGIGWINDSDVISNAIKTDLSYDTLSALAAMYGQGASFYTALMPGSQYTVNNVVCFSPNSKAWEQMRGRFMNGEDVNTSIDTSGIDKSKLSIVVYNLSLIHIYTARQGRRSAGP